MAADVHQRNLTVMGIWGLRCFYAALPDNKVSLIFFKTLWTLILVLRWDMCFPACQVALFFNHAQLLLGTVLLHWSVIFLKTVSEGNSHFHLASFVTRLYHVGSAAFPLGQMFCLLKTPSMIVHTGFKKKQQEVNQKASKESRHGSGFLFNFHIYIHFLNKILKF